MATFAKPENALKRADELLHVGQKQAALQALHDLITSKRYRTWQKAMEKIMFKYVELCVDMRKGRYAKDGLIQYRISCQQVNVASLEEVVKHFLKLATERAEQAQAEAQAQWEASEEGKAAAEAAAAEAGEQGAAGGAEKKAGKASKGVGGKDELADVADLDAEKSPEDLMLSFVSGEKGKERVDRELATPWFKFLWETYRTVLDILRNNSKLEALYAMTAHRAFAFCLQHKRTNEFRRLCEILRNHLANLNKYRDQRDRPDLSQPESLQLYLDTRFEQLKIATELELWQEAFRSVEDIHGLMLLATKAPKAQLMAVYYTKLVKVFWMGAVAGSATGSGGVGGNCCMAATASNSGSLVYHAYAWSKLCYLQRSYNKNLKDRDLQILSSAVVLAALAVPPYDRATRSGALGLSTFTGGGAVSSRSGASEGEAERERCLRMANLIGIVVDAKKDPRDLLSRGALLQEITAKGLLAFALPQVKELYALLETEFDPMGLPARVSPLLDALEDLSNQHKLSAASPIPKVDLHQYAPALRRLAALRTLSQIAKVYDVVRIPNLWKMLAPCGPPVYVESALVESINHGFLRARLDFSEGIVTFGEPNLDSDAFRTHLVTLAKRLGHAAELIEEAKGAKAEAGAQAPPGRTEAALLELRASIEKEHERLLLRKVLIERRKEEAEREITEKEREEQLARLLQQRKTEEAEKARLAAESLRREEERIRREMEAREEEEARQLLLEKRKGKKGKKGEDTAKLDKRQLMMEAMNEQLKEKAEQERRLQKLSKTLDHLERAKREEERPLLEAAYQEFLVEEEKWFHQQQKEKAELSAKQHAIDVVEKQRLSRMLQDKAIFQEQVEGLRWQEFERRRREREEKLAEIREIRHAERVLLRKREFYKRQAEAKAIAEREEEERRKKEEMERKKREEEERLKKLEEIAARQRQREQEAEEKARQERERILGLGRAPAASSAAPATGAAATSGDKPKGFVPSFRRRAEATGEAPPPPSAGGSDRWGGRGDRDRERERESDRPPAGDRPTWSRGDREPEREREREAPAPYRPAAGRYQPPRRDGGEAPPSDSRPSDRWGGGGGGAAGGRGSDAPPPTRSEAPAAPRPAAPAAGGAAPAPGKYVPRHLRGSS